MAKTEVILRRPEVERATGLRRSTIYELLGKDQFPQPIPLVGRAVGWLEREIIEWQAARIAERDKRVA